MEVHSDEEDDTEEEDQGPELPGPPLGQTQLREELTTDVLHLLMTLTSRVTLRRERFPKERKTNDNAVRRQRYMEIYMRERLT